jgi:hypothetical protein
MINKLCKQMVSMLLSVVLLMSTNALAETHQFVAFKHFTSTEYLFAEQGGGHNIQIGYNDEDFSEWNVFQLIDNKDGTFRVRTLDGSYWQTLDDGAIRATADTASASTLYTTVDLGNGSYSATASNGSYLKLVPYQNEHYLSFDGTNDYVDMTVSGPVLGNTFTQEAWIYPTQSDTSFHGFLGDEKGDTANRAPSIWVKEQQVRYGFGDGSNKYVATSGSVLTLNTWNHVAVTFDSQDYILYVNGEQVHNNDNAAGKSPVNQPVSYIGRVENYYFQGQIDEVRIWNTARTQAEIQADMYESLEGTESGLAAYYDFEDVDPSSNRVSDSSINAREGYLMNGTAWMNVNRYSLSFDGSDDYVDLYNSGPVLDNTFTQEAWIYPTHSDTSYHGFLGYQVTGSSNSSRVPIVRCT